MPTLTTLKDVIAFAAETPCPICRQQALEMIDLCSQPGVLGPGEEENIEFDTECTHKPEPN